MKKKIICLKLGEKKIDPFQLFSKKGKIGSFSFRNFLGFCEKKVEWRNTKVLVRIGEPENLLFSQDFLGIMSPMFGASNNKI